MSKLEERAQLVKDYLERHGEASNQTIAQALGLGLGQVRRARNKARWLTAAEGKVLVVPAKADGYLNAITTDPDRARPGFRGQIRHALTRSQTMQRDSAAFGAIAQKDLDRQLAVEVRMYASTMAVQGKIIEDLLHDDSPRPRPTPEGS